MENPESLLLAGETIQFCPTGFSMYPLFHPGKGDAAIVEPIGVRQLKRGDVVLYRRDGNPSECDAQGNQMGLLVLHRIAKIRDGLIFCVGDNQYLVEGPLRPDQMRGVLVGRVRGQSTLSTEAFSYRFITGLWLLLLPCRAGIFRMVKAVRKLIHKAN